MKVRKAKELFHGEEKYNCAQAVLAAFDASEEHIADAKKCGGGRAPEGLCGALHSFRILAGEEAFAEHADEFREKAGGLTCREVRPLGKLSCRECVGLAAELLQRRQD